MSRTQKTKFDAKKKYAVVSLPSEPVQILRCSLWGLGEKNPPELPYIFGWNGHFVGLTRTHAGSKYGSIVSDLKPLYRGAKVIVVRAKWFIRESGLTKQQAPAGPKRHTAVDSFGLVLWWSQQQVFLKVKRANRFSVSVYQMGQRVPRLYLIAYRSRWQRRSVSQIGDG